MAMISWIGTHADYDKIDVKTVRYGPLSLSMIRNLHEKFEIPAEVLIQPARRGGKVGLRRGGTSLSRGGMRKSP
jgi:hypothetical protein